MEKCRGSYRDEVRGACRQTRGVSAALGLGAEVWPQIKQR